MSKGLLMHILFKALIMYFQALITKNFSILVVEQESPMLAKILRMQF